MPRRRRSVVGLAAGVAARRHRARTRRQGGHPRKGARGRARRQHPRRRTGLSQHVSGRGCRRLSDRLCGPFTVPETMMRLGRGNGPQQRLAREPRRRPAGAPAPAGRHRIPRPARRGSVHKFHDGPTYGYSYTWQRFESLVAAADPDPLRDPGARADPGRRTGRSSACARSGVTIGRGQGARGVVLTCGGFKNNQEMIRNYLPGIPYCYTSGRPTTRATASPWRCRSAPTSGT